MVKIFNTRQRPGWTVPWQTQPVESSSGSGAVVRIHGRDVGVLTAAHVVADTRYLQIQRSTDRFSSEKFRARVAAVCHEIDLAFLVVDEPGRCWDDIKPLELGSAEHLPHVFDKVHVVGYPVGGDAVSVTEGVVSRVEVQEYSHSLRAGLALTVDAAINSGNSGGPLLDAATGDVIGVAFQKLVGRGVELQGHAVPAPLIRRFLRDVEAEQAKRPDEKLGDSPLRLHMPSLGCDYQSLEPASLRLALGLDDPPRHGVLVNRLHCTDTRPALCPGDVLLAFNGLKLDDLGFCDLLGRRLHFAAARDLCAVGAAVPLSVWRGGEELTVEHELPPTRHFVPRGQYDCMPQYMVVGGLVFQPLSHEYLQGWSIGERPPHLQGLFLGGHLTPDRTEAVMLSQVLADEVNAGYDSGWVGAPTVRAVNGESVRNLVHLASIIDSARERGGGFLRFDVEMASGPFRVVLPVDGLAQADKRVSQIYGVPAPGRSAGLLPKAKDE